MKALGALKSAISWLNPMKVFRSLFRSGIGSRLQLAFGAAALMTVIACVVSIFSFWNTERDVQQIAHREVPLMTEAQGLSVMSGEISAAAARFVSATTVRDQRIIASQIDDRSMQMRALIDKVRQGTSKEAFSAVDMASRLLENNLSELDTVMVSRSNLRAQIERKVEALHKLHTKLTDVITPIADKAYLDALNRAEGTGNTHLNALRNALELKAQTHQIVSLLSAGAAVREQSGMQPLVDQFTMSSLLLMQAAQSVRNAEVTKDIDTLLEFGRSSDGIFTLRSQELNVSAGAVRAIDENVKVQKQLDQAVSKLVGETKGGMTAGIGRLVNQLEMNRWLLLAIAGVSLLAAGAIAVFYVQRNLVRRLVALRNTMQMLASGQNDVVVPAVKDKDELGEMARSVLVFRDAAIEKERLEIEAAEARRAAEEERERNDAARAEAARQVAEVVDGLGRGLERLAQGDLTYRVRDNWADEYQKIRDDFNGAIGQLQDTLTAIVESTREVSNASAEISTSTTDLSQRTEEQAASLEQTSASMEEISATVRKNAENAQHADGLMRGTRQVADRGGEVVSQAVAAMSRIEDSSRKISDIISVIDEIARQTNLLALNAAVEAARAGEAGRGFAVVASEVRSLAQRSSQAAKDIKDLIVNSSSQVGEGVQLVNRAGDSLKDILSSLNQVAAIVADIAHASSEQASGIDQINRALNQMDEATQQNSALVEENAATAKTLEHQSTALDGRVAAFRLRDGDSYMEEADEDMETEETPIVAAPVRPRATQPVRRAAPVVRGNARQMQSALATAVARDKWEEF
jgi:methyl-accepting chemotaxis protein